MTDMEGMKLAQQQALRAKKRGEVPIGAVVVQNGRVIGRGYNLREHKKNAIWHAETLAIFRACKKVKDWRLPSSTLFVTLEPCMMCLGACLNARIGRVVFGAFDPKGERLERKVVTTLNHSMQVFGGVDEETNRALLQQFFSEHREKKKERKDK